MLGERHLDLFGDLLPRPFLGGFLVARIRGVLVRFVFRAIALLGALRLARRLARARSVLRVGGGIAVGSFLVGTGVRVGRPFSFAFRRAPALLGTARFARAGSFARARPQRMGVAVKQGDPRIDRRPAHAELFATLGRFEGFVDEPVHPERVKRFRVAQHLVDRPAALGIEIASPPQPDHFERDALDDDVARERPRRRIGMVGVERVAEHAMQKKVQVVAHDFVRLAHVAGEQGQRAERYGCAVGVDRGGEALVGAVRQMPKRRVEEPKRHHELGPAFGEHFPAEFRHMRGERIRFGIGFARCLVDAEDPHHADQSS